MSDPGVLGSGLVPASHHLCSLLLPTSQAASARADEALWVARFIAAGGHRALADALDDAQRDEMERRPGVPLPPPAAAGGDDDGDAEHAALAGGTATAEDDDDEWLTALSQANAVAREVCVGGRGFDDDAAFI